MVEDQCNKTFSLFLTKFAPVSSISVSFITAIFFVVFDSKINGIVEDALELRFLGDLVDKCRIGCGVFWMIFFNEIEISSISNNQTVFLKLLEFRVLYFHLKSQILSTNELWIINIQRYIILTHKIRGIY